MVASNKAELKRRLVALAQAAGAKPAAALADSLILLIEGAYAGSQTCGATGKLAALARTAKVVIDAHIGAKR